MDRKGIMLVSMLVIINFIFTQYQYIKLDADIKNQVEQLIKDIKTVS